MGVLQFFSPSRPAIGSVQAPKTVQHKHKKVLWVRPRLFPLSPPLESASSAAAAMEHGSCWLRMRCGAAPAWLQGRTEWGMLTPGHCT